MTHLDVTIRPFESVDQDLVRQLIMQGLAEHFAWLDPEMNPDLDDIEDHYIASGDHFVVAEWNKRIVGAGALVRQSPDIGRIVRVSVASKYRRKGIGQAVVKYLLALAQQSHFRRILVETNLDWDQARALYRYLGFSEYTRDSESIYMEKEI